MALSTIMNHFRVVQLPPSHQHWTDNHFSHADHPTMWSFDELWIPNWATFLCIIISLIYIHYVRAFTFWKKQGVLGPKPLPLIGNIRPFVRLTPVHDIEVWKGILKKGKFDTFLIDNDSELLKQILVRDIDIFCNRRNF